MSGPGVEQNKSVVRAYADAFGGGDFDAIRNLCTPDVVIQGVLGRGNWDYVLPVWQSLHVAYDIKLEIEELIGEGDFVAARYAETGTFRGEFRGLKPTHKSYRVTAMEWFRFENGKIAERWGARDAANIQRQVAAD
jgi:steroid delta-isomerase-like uncharacterized protein